jgi:ABC-type multidrug transport system ATPase subunit
MLLSLRDVSKQYGSSRGLRTTSIEFTQGEIVGLLGPNGSGKTTMLRLAAGLLTPSTGRVELDNKPPRDQLRRFAFLSTSAVFPEWMKHKKRSSTAQSSCATATCCWMNAPKRSAHKAQASSRPTGTTCNECDSDIVVA